MGQKVISREYKVMLRPQRFAGDEKALQRTAKAFWRDFARALDGGAVPAEGELGEVKAQRLIRFLDTPGRRLNAGNYIFRERCALTGGDREMTLKFRHPDRHIAAARDMAPDSSAKARTKFEEDIKAPFVSLYSFSTTLPVKDRKTFTALADVARVFEDVPGRLAGFEPGEALEVVNGFTARELVLGGGAMRQSRKRKTVAECGLIVWYDNDRGEDKPCAVEFSYRYGDKRERYPGGLTQRAYEAFSILQTSLGAWVEPKPRTKTAFVYG
jgi:hypothetical protein